MNSKKRKTIQLRQQLQNLMSEMASYPFESGDDYNNGTYLDSAINQVREAISNLKTTEATYMDEEKVNWELHIGCHSGTLTSRDSAVFEDDMYGNKLTSLKDCIQLATLLKQGYLKTGSQVWFADAIDPEGNGYENIIPYE